MTVTDQQLRAIAFLTKPSRPNGARRWDEAGIMAALEQIRDRALPEVVMAAIRCAADRDIDTPAVIALPGPHWQAAAVVKVAPSAVKVPVADLCGICSKPAERCRSGRVADDDHAFEARGPKPSTDVPRVVAALKDNLAPIAPRTEPAGLDALTERRPELAAAAERIAAACPGLQPTEEIA